MAGKVETPKTKKIRLLTEQLAKAAAAVEAAAVAAAAVRPETVPKVADSHKKFYISDFQLSSVRLEGLEFYIRYCCNANDWTRDTFTPHQWHQAFLADGFRC